MKNWKINEITEKEILEIRNLCAEDGMELTPQEVKETIKIIKLFKEISHDS